MYIIEIPHQRPAIGYDDYDTTEEWAEATAESAIERRCDVPDLRGNALVEWACSDFHDVIMLHSLADVRALAASVRAQGAQRHQGSRILAICDAWIADAEATCPGCDNGAGDPSHPRGYCSDCACIADRDDRYHNGRWTCAQWLAYAEEYVVDAVETHAACGTTDPIEAAAQGYLADAETDGVLLIDPERMEDVIRAIIASQRVES